MQDYKYANQISGRAVGALFFAAFGAIWLLLAFYALERLTITTILGIASVLLGLVLAATHLMRQARHWPTAPEDPKLNRAFKLINALQYIAIAAVVIGFNALHLQPYLMCGIAFVVGLHMFPLAHIFKYTPHHFTGAALVLWAVVSAVVSPIEHMQGISALGTGILLWLSSTYTLASTWHGTQYFPNSTSA